MDRVISTRKYWKLGMRFITTILLLVTWLNVEANQVIGDPVETDTSFMKWSPDSSKIAVIRTDLAYVDGELTYVNPKIEILNPSTYQVLVTILQDANVLAWRPGANEIASVGSDGMIRRWNTVNGQAIATYQHSSASMLPSQYSSIPTISVAYNAGGTILASSGFDNIIRFWDLSTGNPTTTINLGTPTTMGLDHAPNWIAWNINDSKFAAANWDGMLRIWQSVTASPIFQLPGHVGALSSGAWSPNGAKIATSGMDNTLRLWDASTGNNLFVLQGHTDIVGVVSWSPDGTRLASAGADATVRIWNTLTGQQTNLIQASDVVWALDWSSDGRLAYIPRFYYGLNGPTTPPPPNISTPPSPAPPTSIPPTSTPPPSSTTGLLGQYYDNSDLTNRILNRVDSIVDFNWGTGSPHSLIAVDTFSIRWTGQVVPQYTQTYTFYTQSDDGVRLWVNGQQIINNWTNHASTENSGTIALTAGVRYSVRMEYYENTNGTIARLSWSSSSQPKQVIPTNRLLPNGLIAFQSYRNGNDEIYLVNGDGTNQINFTNNAAADQFPTTAVGAQNLVFASTRTGNAEIFSAPLAGGTPVNLTNHGSYDHYAAQDQDGRVVFSSTRSPGGNFDLWKVDAGGANLTQLTNSTGAERNPNWSPDGQWIVYDMQVNNVTDLWKIPAAGGIPIRLTQNAGSSNSDPSWSPDGTTIVFHSTRDGGHYIYLMNYDGSNPRPFKTGGLNGFNPTWSPDGTYITYQAYPSSQPDIYSILLGGTTSTQLTNNAAADQAASWGVQ